MFYQNMNKNNPAGQLAVQEWQYTHIWRQQGAHDSAETDMMNAVEMAPLSLQCHHHLSDSPGNTISLAEYLIKHQGDLALKVCVEHPT